MNLLKRIEKDMKKSERYAKKSYKQAMMYAKKVRDVETQAGLHYTFLKEYGIIVPFDSFLERYTPKVIFDWSPENAQSRLSQILYERHTQGSRLHKFSSHEFKLEEKYFRISLSLAQKGRGYESLENGIRKCESLVNKLKQNKKVNMQYYCSSFAFLWAIASGMESYFNRLMYLLIKPPEGERIIESSHLNFEIPYSQLYSLGYIPKTIEKNGLVMINKEDDSDEVRINYRKYSTLHPDRKKWWTIDPSKAKNVQVSEEKTTKILKDRIKKEYPTQ